MLSGTISAKGCLSGTISAAYTNVLMTKEDKIKLDGIDDGANNYILPPASEKTLGGVTFASSEEVGKMLDKIFD